MIIASAAKSGIIHAISSERLVFGVEGGTGIEVVEVDEDEVGNAVPVVVVELLVTLM